MTERSYDEMAADLESRFPMPRTHLSTEAVDRIVQGAREDLIRDRARRDPRLHAEYPRTLTRGVLERVVTPRR